MITKVLGMPVFQYAMFSGEPLLPKMPSHLSASSPLAASLVKSLTIPAFHGVKGGEAAFLDEYLDLPNDLTVGKASRKQDATKREVFFLCTILMAPHIHFFCAVSDRQRSDD